MAVIKGAYLEKDIQEINKKVELDYNTIMKDVENLEGTFTLREYKEAYTMMDLNIQNMTKNKIDTCGFVPFINYFTQNDDS